MLKRRLGTLFLVTCLILTTVPAALGGSSAQVINVAGDGSGDFNCDGKDDQIQINQALEKAAGGSGVTTVHLKGPFTYVIDDTLLIGSNTILEGDSSAKIKLVSNAGWEAWKPLIKERSSDSHDITIRGFTIDGNREGNDNVVSGKGYYNLIHLTGCQNIDVSNMYLTNNHGDGLKTNRCSNVKFYNNKIYMLGHDGLYASTCSNVEAYDNEVTCRTNSALRLYNTNHASFHDNIITSENTGGAGIEIQKYGSPEMDDIKVYNNIISKTKLAGIWLFGSSSYSPSSANVHIYNNQIYDTGLQTSNEIIGGIVSNGFNVLAENNIFDGCYGAAISQRETYTTAPGSGYTITAKKNIITNTRPSSAGGSGHGICNELKSTHSFVLENNCLYGNEGGDYKGAGDSSSDIKEDPQYVDRDNRNYNLKSTSPCTSKGIGNKEEISKSEPHAAIDNQASVRDPSAEEIEKVNPENITSSENKTLDNETTVPEPEPGNESEVQTEATSSDKTDADEIALFESEKGDEELLADENTAGDSSDNRIREASPDTVYKELPYLDTGSRPGIGKYRDLLLFNLDEYNNSENISKATLSLNWFYPDSKERPEDTVIEVYRPASAWNPEGVTWNSKDNGVSWEQPGGDWFDKNNVSHENTPYATITLKGSNLPDNKHYDLDVTNLVNEYASGKYENTGFLIKTGTENADYVAFHSSEAENEDQRPRLNIE